jgi:hypothetical protein
MEVPRTKLHSLSDFNKFSQSRIELKKSKIILPPSQYIRRKHLWFKDQELDLILSIPLHKNNTLYIMAQEQKNGYTLYYESK